MGRAVIQLAARNPFERERVKAGMQRAKLTVHISTKPNRSHVVHGKTSLILPTLGRTDKDDKHPGGAQFLSVEDSMGVTIKGDPQSGIVATATWQNPLQTARVAMQP